MSSTTAWLNSNPVASSNYIDVPEVLLQALIWKYFDRTTSWVNMSFTISNTSLDVLSPVLMIGSKRYGFLAAGNDALELSPNSVPQGSATLFPNLVNVTYGDVNGIVYGAYSGAEYNTRVTVVAPGCGLSFGTLAAQDYGSSFASPYVASAAWVRFLSEGARYSPSSLKQELILGRQTVALSTEEH